MAARKKIEEMDDREFEELLKLLRQVEARDPETVRSGRANYTTELDSLIENGAQYGIGLLAGLSSTFSYVREIFTMNNSTPRFVFSALAAVIVIFILLFSSASATVYAAQSALPGDTLYSLKTGLEQTQVNISRDAANRAQLHLDFAGRRLNETAALIEEGRFNDIGAATAELEYHIQQAIGELQMVALGDPARAETLATDIAAALTRYASTLSGMLGQVPDSVRPEVERAIQLSQMDSDSTDSGMDDSQDEIEFSGVLEEIGSGTWLVGGQIIAINADTEIQGDIQVGDYIKVHAWQNQDGSITAREIQLTDDPQVGIENDNEAEDNSNANINSNDDGGNLNENVNNGNENGNYNDNGNVNEDDNGSYNENDDNGNLNDNEDNSSSNNGNSNDNENDRDDNSNSNNNDNDHNDNHSDNDNDHSGDNDNGDD